MLQGRGVGGKVALPALFASIVMLMFVAQMMGRQFAISFFHGRHVPAPLERQLFSTDHGSHKNRQVSTVSRKGEVTKVRPRRTSSVCFKGQLTPTLFLLGAQKGGSTSLFDSLIEVQGIQQPTPLNGDPSFFRKEVHIFDVDDR